MEDQSADVDFGVSNCLKPDSGTGERVDKDALEMVPKVLSDDPLPNPGRPKEGPEADSEVGIVVKSALGVKKAEEEEGKGLDDAVELEEERDEGGREESMDGLGSCLVDLGSNAESIGGDEERGSMVDRPGELLGDQLRSSASGRGEMSGAEEVEFGEGKELEELSSLREIEVWGCRRGKIGDPKL